MGYEPRSKSELFENDKLEDAFLGLSKVRKKVLYLYFVEEISYEEIASMLNLEVKNVRRIKERGIVDLRKILLEGIKYE